MDLEYPSITRTLRTGYPYNEKETHGNESQYKTTNLDYNKVSEESQMSLLEMVEKNLKINQELRSKLKEDYGVIGVRFGENTAEIQFFKVEDFFRATEGHPIIFEESDKDKIALSTIGNVIFVILLSKRKEIELRELLKDE